MPACYASCGAPTLPSSSTRKQSTRKVRKYKKSQKENNGEHVKTASRQRGVRGRGALRGVHLLRRVPDHPRHGGGGVSGAETPVHRRGHPADGGRDRVRRGGYRRVAGGAEKEDPHLPAPVVSHTGG